MNALGFLWAWYNIPFLVALGCCLLFAILQLLGGGNDSDADADVDSDADVDGDGFFSDAMSALGVGRVPLTLILTAFLGSLGALGLLLNTIATNLLGGYPSIAFVPLLLGAALLALPTTAALSRSFARLAPDISTAVGYEQLVGRAGTVVSPQVSQSYGRVQVRDTHGALHTVFAVIADGEPLRDGSEVALLSYDPIQRRFVVGALDPLRR